MSESDLDSETVEVVVTGKVQAVGFRAAAARHAHLHEVNGWVRNAPDGSVELLLQGKTDKVDRLLSWLYQGPEHARVEHVHVIRSYDDRRYQHFQIR